MPEGDTIFQTARRLRAVLEGQRIAAVRSSDQTPGFAVLAEAIVSGVEARGKHLLMHTDRDLIVHSHMGMNGSWHVYDPDQKWRQPAWQAQLELSTSTHQIVCFSPKTLELLTRTQLVRHEFLNRLGPDLLSQTFDPAIALRRFRVHGRIPIGEAVMNQSIVSGIGNVYKSEVLFLTQTNPFLNVRDLSDDQVAGIIGVARHHLLRNTGGHRRQTRFAGPGGPLWVYGRSGLPCFECGAIIEMRRQGALGRTTYWCPSCQLVEPEKDRPVEALMPDTADPPSPGRRIRMFGS